MDKLLNLGEFSQKRNPLTGVIPSACPQGEQILALKSEILSNGERVTATFENTLKIA